MDLLMALFHKGFLGNNSLTRTSPAMGLQPNQQPKPAPLP
jgi:hypothetical protein